MNKKVFVFCIGGTGERVMKSIVMLMAAGMSTNGYTIMPIIIDPHLDLEEKKNLQTLINDYISIRNRMVVDGKAPDGFFNAKIDLLNTADTHTNDTNKAAGEDRSFAEFIEMGNLGQNSLNKYLIQTLFSEKNLNDKLSEGFRGNPNVGTVVLQEQQNGASWFDVFKIQCGKEDRVFIISSIFGGTGASGYPLLERKIRFDKSSDIVSDVFMGAVSVLPYYSLDDPKKNNSNIDSANFITKAKAALTYYEKTVKADMLYYVGEQTFQCTHENNEKTQPDKANFIELVAASALFDFLKRDEKPKQQQYLTRAIKNDVSPLDLQSAGEGYAPIVKCMADVCILNTLLDVLPKEKYFPLKKECSYDEGFYKNDMKAINDFMAYFMRWYKELSDCKRQFAPIKEIKPFRMSDIVKNSVELDAKDDSYYLLEMIKNGGNFSTSKVRDFMECAYKAIDTYTKKIKN